LDYYIYITEYFDFYGIHFNGLAKDNLEKIYKRYLFYSGSFPNRGPTLGIKSSREPLLSTESVSLA